MSKTIEAPIDLLEEMGELRFPASTNARMQQLMDRNNDGALTAEERGELESLVEWSQRASLIRARVFHLLGRPLK